MSNDKKNLADLLEEYFPGAGKQAEEALNEMFGEQTAEETASEPREDILEIITDDGGDSGEEVPDEPFDVPGENSEKPAPAELSTLSEWSDWAEETIAAGASFDGRETAGSKEVPPDAEETEAVSEPETEDTETADVPEKETAEEVPDEKEKEVPTEKEEKAAEITEIDDTDVNEKWLVKFAKGIFPVRGDSVFEVIRKIIFMAAVVVFVGAGVMLTGTLIQSKKAVEIQSSMREVIETTVATTIDENGNVVTIPPTDEEIAEHNRLVAENFKAINEDYVGYLELAGCEIFEPVVKGRDVGDEYYLKHNIYGELNKAGTIYMDARCTVTPEYTSPNIVLYGHNQEDGTMFGHLKYYKVDYTQEPINIDFYKENPVVKFSPEFDSGEYLIYAFFVTNALEKQDSNGVVFHYHDYIETMSDESTFNWYMGEVQKRNQIISPVDVRFGDKLLVLSTCSNEFTESRFVVFARKLREGESVSDYDFSEARINPSAQGVDWDAILSGETSDTTAAPETEETIDEFTTHKKSLGKRNEKTYRTEAETTVTTVETTAETAETTVTTVPESETETETTETAGTDTTDESASETAVTDENGETLTDTESGSDGTDESGDGSESSEESESETGESTTKKKKSSKSNK
ncbi:MAG: sortase [Ruminococcus sp.]|nr:sortase [Ruminococcus sp.]MCM1382415.1 sortase [Muribaculaceae bacterium]MCM1479091.1 sortase [Muribaculaceae bacterium]